jgi:hypothetical protein
METRRNHFEELPEDVREKAFKATAECPNLYLTTLDEMLDSTIAKNLCLLTAFSWGLSKEGAEYWQGINEKYFSHE